MSGTLDFSLGGGGGEAVWLVGSGPRCVAPDAKHRSGSFGCSAIDARQHLRSQGRTPSPKAGKRR